mgnify:CR=1 FL=1
MPGMRVTLGQLKAFEAVARLGSFSGAGKELFITQPAVSKKVRQLQDEVGLPLIDQVGKKLFLTEAGRLLLGVCTDWLDTWARFEQSIADLQGLKRGRLKIAVVTTSKYFMPRVLGPFCERYPGIDVAMEVINRDRLLERLARKVIEFEWTKKEMRELRLVLNNATERYHFFQEEHPKLEPVSTPTSGVFLAGACQGPKDIPDTVAQAKGAAAEALALSASGEVAVAPMISSIDPDICVGCQVCIGLCAYSAIEFNELKGVSEVNEAVCKGCGSCSAYCPSGAAKVRHFTDNQIFEEIDGLLAG